MQGYTHCWNEVNLVIANFYASKIQGSQLCNLLLSNLKTIYFCFIKDQFSFHVLYKKNHDCMSIGSFGCSCFPLLRPYNNINYSSEVHFYGPLEKSNLNLSLSVIFQRSSNMCQSSLDCDNKTLYQHCCYVCFSCCYSCI